MWDFFRYRYALPLELDRELPLAMVGRENAEKPEHKHDFQWGNGFHRIRIGDSEKRTEPLSLPFRL